MADIPSNLDKHNDIEISSDAPITESLMNKIGANINGLIDLAGFNFQEFLTSGTFNVPEGVTRVLLFGCGGGGGGGSGVAVNSASCGTGGSGGDGSKWLCYTVPVTPLDAIAVTIGSGGTTNANGGNTSFAALATFYGGRAGRPGFLNSINTSGVSATSLGGDNGGGSFSLLGSIGYAMPGGNSLGQGGAAGSSVNSRSGGGGGGASYSNGGSGGNASNGSGIPGSAANANTGAGGGGGGASQSSVGLGAAGGSGRLWVLW